MFELSSEQQAVVNNVLENNNVIVSATAGSGKTALMRHIMEHLVNDGKQVWALSFSNIAADQLQMPGVEATTTSKLGYAILADYFWSDNNRSERRKKYNNSKTFDKYSWVASTYLEKLGLEKAEKRAILQGGLRAMLDFVRQDMAVTPEDYQTTWEKHFSGILPQDFVGYIDDILAEGKAMFERNLSIDYIDCVTFPTMFDTTLHGFKFSFNNGAPDYIICDEFQDFSTAEIRLVVEYAKTLGTKIIAVGDTKQAIYGWRGACGDAFEQLAEQIDCEILPLTLTFRCPKLHTDYIRNRWVSFGEQIPPQIVEENIFSAKDEDGILVKFTSLDEFLPHIIPGETLIMGRNVNGEKAKLFNTIEYLLANTDYNLQLEGFQFANIVSPITKVMRSERCTPEAAARYLLEEEIRKNEDGVPAKVKKGSKANQKMVPYYSNLNDYESELQLGLRIINMCHNCTTPMQIDDFIESRLNGTDILLSTVFRAKGMTKSVVLVTEIAPLFDERQSEMLNVQEINNYFVMLSRSNKTLFVPA